MSPVSIERIRALLRLDADSNLRWRVAPSRRVLVNAGDVAGGKISGGYLQIGIDGHRILAHRIVFALEHGRWPVGHVDHINGDPSDNRPSNLREASRSDNNRNVKLTKANTSGYKGVSWSARAGGWRAAIKKSRKSYHLGYFPIPGLAALIYATAAARLHGDFANIGVDL